MQCKVLFPVRIIAVTGNMVDDHCHTDPRAGAGFSRLAFETTNESNAESPCGRPHQNILED